MSKLICFSSKRLCTFSLCDFFFFFYMYIALNTLNTKHILGFPDSSLVKNLLAMQETPLPFLGGEDLLEKG